MAINLTKYKDALQAAWKDVLDDKTPTDWALFGYDGQTNDLKFVSKGAGGIEEMADDLNSGKIMYAFCKVLDPKTSLPKCVLINWQGEGAPLVRKGTCANHIRDVSNFFKGAHLTVNARNEEEVDSQLIIDKVAKSTGSVYSFKERAEVNEHVAPIGTSYKKVIPTQEINSKERDKFWERAEQEEKQRQEEERKRREEERCKLESEQKQRELVEAQIRDERAKERNRNINQLRQAEQHANSREQEKVVSAAEELAEREREEQERKGRSELLRRQRSQEAQAVISQRTINARAVFEQNTAAGQMHNTRQQKAEVFSPTLAARLSPQLQSPLVEQSEEPEIHIETPEMYTDKQHYNTTVQQDLPVETVRTEEHIKENTSWRDNNNMQTTLTDEINKQVKEPVPEQTVEDILSYEPIQLGSDLGLQARALYDYQAADPTEITFDPGDIISHIDQIDEGWWQGLGPDGTFGLFPANYVELIN